MAFTGDELTLNDKSYVVKDRTGHEFLLGKLLKREQTYDPFHGSYSTYNNNFVFEHMPDNKFVYNVSQSWNVKTFYLAPVETTEMTDIKDDKDTEDDDKDLPALCGSF